MIPCAGPACFLDEALLHHNDADTDSTIFPRWELFERAAGFRAQFPNVRAALRTLCWAQQGGVLIFSVSFQFLRMLPVGNPCQ